MELTEFLLARIAEDEAVARCTCAETGGACGGGFCDERCPTCRDGDRETRDWRPLAECEAKRRIVALHREWPVLIQTEPTMERVGADVDSMVYRASQEIQWATNREYVARFGTEPPTTPILRALASIYADHPDFDPAWA